MGLEAIFGGIIVALISGIIGKALADVKITKIVDKMTNIEMIVNRLEAKLDDIDTIKHDIEQLFDRVRELERDLAVHKSAGSQRTE